MDRHTHPIDPPTGLAAIYLLVAALVICAVLDTLYVAGGYRQPGPLSHDGQFPAAARVHSMFSIFAFYTLLGFFLRQTAEPVSTDHACIVWVLLFPFFAIGAVQFSSRWKPIPLTYGQVIGLWLITGVGALYHPHHLNILPRSAHRAPGGSFLCIPHRFLIDHPSPTCIIEPRASPRSCDRPL